LDRKLSGSVVLKGEQTGTLSVQLQPWASVTGRLVDGNDKPVAGVELQDTYLPTNLRVKGSNGEPARIDESYVTDAEGRFCIEGLAPGLKYRPRVFDKKAGKYLNMGTFEVALEPGEAKDLGEVSVVVNASAWCMTLVLDTPNLEPPVVQYAILDKDPVPGFKARVARLRRFQQRQLEPGDLLRKQAMRTARMTVNWDLGFRDVTGADLHLLVSSPFRSHNVGSNDPDGKKWVVTKTVQIAVNPPAGACRLK